MREEKQRQELARRLALIDEGADTGLGVPKRYWGVTLAKTTRIPDNASALDTVMAWQEDPRGMLMLWGRVGVGKTHFAVAVLHELYLRGCDGLRFLDVAKLIAALRRQVFDADLERERIAREDVLVLDDLGLQGGTDWAREHVVSLISRREAEERPTIVTSNLSLEELSKAFDDRLASRLAGGKVIRMGGRDWRLPGEGSR
ncbi:MAG: ATP-binding protein [Planctomycetota bacterium]